MLSFPNQEVPLVRCVERFCWTPKKVKEKKKIYIYIHIENIICAKSNLEKGKEYPHKLLKLQSFLFVANEST